jgi:hypothetical protein
MGSQEIQNLPASDLIIGACQPMPKPSKDELAALRASIEEHGVEVPVEAYADCSRYVVCDGNNPAAIAAEMGLAVPLRVVDGLTQATALEYAQRVNVVRRHLDREQKRQLALRELEQDADRSDTAIARLCGLSDKTVATVRVAFGNSERDGSTAKTQLGGISLPTSLLPGSRRRLRSVRMRRSSGSSSGRRRSRSRQPLTSPQPGRSSRSPAPRTSWWRSARAVTRKSEATSLASLTSWLLSRPGTSSCGRRTPSCAASWPPSTVPRW